MYFQQDIYYDFICYNATVCDGHYMHMFAIKVYCLLFGWFINIMQTIVGSVRARSQNRLKMNSGCQWKANMGLHFSITKWYFCDGSRITGDQRTVEYSELYYRSNRVLADLFYAGDASKCRLEFSTRDIVMDNASRLVQPRSHTDRRVLQKLPVLLYHSFPERNVLDQLKEKVHVSIVFGHWSC